jgi:hypothetical protein
MKKQNKNTKAAKGKLIEPPYIKTLLQLIKVGWISEEDINCKDIKYILERDGEHALINSKGEVTVI